MINAYSYHGTEKRNMRSCNCFLIAIIIIYTIIYHIINIIDTKR